MFLVIIHNPSVNHITQTESLQFEQAVSRGVMVFYYRPANNSRSSDCGINAFKFVLFDFSPYIIGVRDKSRRGPFSSKELNLCHYFR